jgi:glucose-1-phosphate thymidylyltransferase
MGLAKAIVLVRPVGHRAWRLGRRPAQLAQVANEPVIHHALRTLRHSGARSVLVMAYPDAEEPIREAIGNGVQLGLDVQYAEARDPAPLRHTVRCFADHLGNPPFLIQHADVLFRESLTALHGQYLADGLDGLVLRHGSGGDQAAGGNAYIIGAGILRALCDVPGSDLERALEAVLSGHRRGRFSVGTRQVDALLPCRGGAETLLEANRRLLDDLAPSPVRAVWATARFDGRVAIHATASVSDAVIRGPVIIGPRARISNAYIGPHTAVGAGVVIDGAEVEDSIVMEGARVGHVRDRISGSVIGPDASVGQDFSLPRGLRLAVGAGASVVLA